MPNEQRHYSNELNLESVGINLPYNMQADRPGEPAKGIEDDQ